MELFVVVQKRRAPVRHVKVSASHGNVVGRAAESVDSNTIACTLHSGGVAAGSSRIAGGDEDRHPLRRRLLPKRLVERVAGGAEEELALSIAVAHYWSKIVIHDIDGRQIGALGHLCALRDNIVDRRAAGDGP